MIELKCLTLDNFKCYEHAVFEFPVIPGLYSVSGENLDNPNLGTNGIGKSALFDALMWVFFGYTSQGQRGFRVSSTEKDEVSVEVEFSRNNTQHRFQRVSRSGETRLTLDSGMSSQEEIDRLLGRDRSEWLKSVYFSQGSTGFLDWTPAMRMEFLQNYLNLEIWERMRARLSCGRDRLEQSISSLTGEEKALQKAHDILALGISNEDWGARTLELQSLMDTMGKDCPIPPGNPPERPERPQCIEENTLLGSLCAHRDSIEKSLTRFRNLDGPECPLCGGPIDRDTTIREIDKLNSKLGELQLYERSVRQRMESKMMSYQTELKNFSKLSEERQKLEREYVIIRERRSDLERKLGEIGILRERQEQDRKKLSDLRTEIGRVCRERSVLFTYLDLYLFWINRIKPIQMLCVENFLSQINFRIGGILSDLGMDGWTVILKTSKTKADGESKPDLSVLVSNRESSDVSWVSLSGGEKQRLRLAVLLALVPLFDASFNIMIFDEPATGISSEGLDRFIEVTARMAQEQGKVIFLIDHWLLESEHFSGRIWITKTRDGSSIEQRN